MDAGEIAKLLEEAEEWLTPSSDRGTLDPDVWGSYEDVIRGLAALVRELTDPPADLTYTTGVDVHWRGPVPTGQVAGTPKPSCRPNPRHGPAPATHDVERVTCWACRRIIELVTWRPMESAPRVTAPVCMVLHEGVPTIGAHHDRTDETWAILREGKIVIVPRASLGGWLPLPEAPR